MIDYWPSTRFPCRPVPRNRIRWTATSCTFSYEARQFLEDPWFDSLRFEEPQLFTTLSVLPEDAPDKPEFVTIDFKKGDAVAVNGKHFPARRDEDAQQDRRQTRRRSRGHGGEPVRRMKSRGVYETPGGAILHFAHRQMEASRWTAKSCTSATRSSRNMPSGLQRFLVCARTPRVAGYVTRARRTSPAPCA